jgi:hypothetical protein
MTIYDCPILDFQEAEAGNYDKVGGREVFEALSNELINQFGLTEINQIIFHKQKQLIKTQLKRIYSEDKSLDIWIEIYERELQNLLNKTVRTEDIRKLQATNHRIISEWSKRDSTKLTVFHYYNDLRDFEKEMNARKNKQRYNTPTGYSRSNPKGT